MTLVELILAPHSAYAGKTIKEMNFRRKYGFTVLAILRRGRSYRTDVGDMSLEPGDLLLIVGPPRRLRDLRINPDIIIFEPDPATRPVPRRRAVISVLVFAVCRCISFAWIAGLSGCILQRLCWPSCLACCRSGKRINPLNGKSSFLSLACMRPVSA